MVVLALFVVILSTITNSSLKLWRSTNGSIKMFASARTAYGVIETRLSQATLNTYLDYYDTNWSRRTPTSPVTFVATHYGRASDLDFYSGNASSVLGGSQQGGGIFFFAPLGYTNNSSTYADMPNLLNAIGYYVEWGSDSTLRPAFLSALPQKYGFRLIENILPSQSFTSANGGFPDFTDTITANDTLWIKPGLSTNTTGKSVLADNIIALIIRPEVSQQDAQSIFGGSGNSWNLTTDYTYNSRSVTGALRPAITPANPTALQFAQLPPLLRVVMVAVDEASARRITTGTTPPTALQLKPTWFQAPANLDTDLAALGQQLSNAGVAYRIFNEVISLRGAKFSTQAEK